MRNTLGICAVLLLGISVGGKSEGTCNCHGGDHCGCCPAHECVTKPGVKTVKKTVYDVKCVPVCEHQPAKFLAPCDCCPVCKLKYKKVLIKREVSTEVCITTCVPVEVCPHCACNQDKVPTAPTAAAYAPIMPPPAQVVVE